MAMTPAEREEMLERAQRIANAYARALVLGDMVAEALLKPRSTIGEDLVRSISGVAGVTEEQARQVSALLVNDYDIAKRVIR